MDGWQVTYADDWARGVLSALDAEFPSAAGHLATGPDDCDVSPRRLHPAFWGCLDWHSSAHMQWSAVTLLTHALDALDPRTADALVGTLADRLTPERLAVEASYLQAHPGFERPYGWGWVTLLAAASARLGEAGTPLSRLARGWADALTPVADVVFGNLLGWLPRQAYPVRTGAHDNSAFGLALCLDAARTLGRPDVASAIERRALDWYGADRDYPVAWEPGGSDFLSAALCEADLLRRVLPAGEFSTWLGRFLPDLGAEGDPLLVAPQVLDRTDGKLVHLFGLALSRAWLLRSLAPYLDADRAARVAASTPALIDHTLPEITAGDFMSTHWLVSFALMAVRSGRP